MLSLRSSSRVQGVGIRGRGLGFGFEGVGCGVQDSRFRSSVFVCRDYTVQDFGGNSKESNS